MNTLHKKKYKILSLITLKSIQEHTCLKGAFHRSLTVLVRYRFPLHRVYETTKYQYLAFDVSLPPPIYLSCSPKQLDSGIIYNIKYIL